MQFAKQKMRQIRTKMKYADRMVYHCYLCQQVFSEPVHAHFASVHGSIAGGNQQDIMNLVQVVPLETQPPDPAPGADKSAAALITTRRIGSQPTKASPTPNLEVQSSQVSSSTKTPPTPSGGPAAKSQSAQQHEQKADGDTANQVLRLAATTHVANKLAGRSQTKSPSHE